MAARVLRCAVVVLFALLLGACGGGDDESDAGQASAAPTTAQEEPSSTPSQASVPDGGDDGGDEAGEDVQIYVVRSGDTLSVIAQRFDTTVQAIVRANDISDPDLIDIGQRLRIPGG